MIFLLLQLSKVVMMIAFLIDVSKFQSYEKCDSRKSMLSLIMIWV